MYLYNACATPTYESYDVPVELCPVSGGGIDVFVAVENAILEKSYLMMSSIICALRFDGGN
jgi:hypothetical protein